MSLTDAQRGNASEPKPDGASVSDQDAPLCVDLDGTLLRIDTLVEAAVGVIATDWLAAPRLLVWLAHGKIRLKTELARRWDFDPATLPYNRPLLAHLKAERQAGRTLILATAAHRLIAERIAGHLGLFDEIIATDGEINLRGAVKAHALCSRFGEGHFIYAGNDHIDQAVWDRAGGAVLANAPASVERMARARHPDAISFTDGTPSPRAALRALRPYQWVKNALCLVPPVAAGDFAAGSGLFGAVAIAIAFCFVASGLYLINDMLDLAADRAHPRKRRRPFANGDLSVLAGIILCPVLLLGGALLGWVAGALPALAVYAVSSLAYSLWLKEQPLVDVFALAGLYTLRLFGGGEASGHPVSLWLLGFSSFLFLSLALIKRVSELQRVQRAGDAQWVMRRGYMVDDLALLQAFGAAATFASAIVLSLYVQSDTASRAYAHPAMLWGSIPLLLFWQCRLWLSTSRGYMHDDPIVYAARDWVSWLVFVGLAIVAALAWLPLR